MNKQKRRVVIGDVFSLPVRSGFAHIQTIGTHPRGKNRWIVRVLARIYEECSPDASMIASQPDCYTVFAGDLGYCEKLGQITFVGNADVPSIRKDWKPIMRGNSFHEQSPRRAENWWLDDGVKEWRIGRLTTEQQALTSNDFVPPLALSKLIDRGWDLDFEFKGPGAPEYLRAQDLLRYPRRAFR